MKHICLLFLFQFICFWTFGQNVNHFDYDTLKYRHLTFGDLDSTDKSSQGLSSSFLFPAFNSDFYFVNTSYIFEPGNSVYNNFKVNAPKMQFTALPHIGFGYVFGAQGSQKLNFDYEQAFKHGFLINCSINNLKSNGFFRNSQAALNAYQFSFARNAKRYSFQLSSIATKDARNWNGGIKDDSLVGVISSALIPVWKENAQSTRKNLFVSLKNKFSLLNDSIKTFGIATNHSYNRFKRFYIEEDSLSTLYNNIYIDSSKSNDSLIQQNIQNGLGLFFNRNKFFAEAGLNTDYWNYQTFQIKNDTLEVGLYSKLDVTIQKFQVYQKGNFNLVGASGGIENLAGLQTRIGDFYLRFSHHLSNQLPTVFQRYFSCNNVFYKSSNLQKQFYQNFNLNIGKSIRKQQFNIEYCFNQFNRVYQFDSMLDLWRNDLATSKGVIQQVSLKSKMQWGSLHAVLMYRYTGMDESKRFVPAHFFDSRIYVKGGIFKAKKLKALFGLEFMIASSYKRLNFNPQMSIFDLEQATFNANAPGFINAAVFTSFEVETFRLFIRMDNLASFWQDKKIELLKGYSFPSPQIKVGITWDFWN